jgi:putative zinc finger/helix-turn-helix YgiT family protein
MENPYHFTASGLDNVFLVDIHCFVCSDCGEVSAEIPAVRQLLSLIARDLVQKPFALTGSEVRFLRKRLRKKQIDFARQIGLEPETLSRIENGHLQPSEPTDKLTRLYYALASRDPLLLRELQREVDAMMTQWRRVLPPKKIIATVSDNNEWKVDLVAA